jgi:uncharacterized RmlC-like cupin family protein
MPPRKGLHGPGAERREEANQRAFSLVPKAFRVPIALGLHPGVLEVAAAAGKHEFEIRSGMASFIRNSSSVKPYQDEAGCEQVIEMSEGHEQVDWKIHGVKVIPGDHLDPNTAQTPGMDRAAAINLARVGAQKIWAGTATIHPNAKTGAHHHGALETVIYVIKGQARMRWGEHLEYIAEAGPGDFIFVPPYVPHQEINASTDAPLECVVVRSDNEAVVVNLDIEPVERPEKVRWIDPIHRHG